MGCCPSKCPSLVDKHYVVSTTEAVAEVPSNEVGNQVEYGAGDTVQEMLMDRGDGAPMVKSDYDEPMDEPADDGAPTVLKLSPDDQAASFSLDGVLRGPESASFIRAPQAQRKSSRNADDIPISSTYHRVHSAEVEEHEAKRKEELRLEAEQREREVREYKVAMQMSV